MSEKNRFVFKKYYHEIQTIENLTKLKAHHIVYDSKLCHSEIYESTFNRLIFNKNNLMILIDDHTSIDIGGFIFNTIDKCSENDSEVEKGIIDDNAFLFIFKDSIVTKYPMKNENMEKNELSFHLYETWDDRLFSFGNDDVVVYQNFDFEFSTNQQSLFDLKNLSQIVYEKETIKLTLENKLNRIIVIQFVDSN